MTNRFFFELKSVLKHDLPASITVFFVALPLCLGIALASGAPPHAGIITGAIGGILVSVISKSTFSVSGPAAGLSTIVAAGIVTAGSFENFLPAVVIAGLFQITLGALRVGGFVNYFPSSVIKGMLAGIGVLLIGKQVPVIFGIEGVEFWSDLQDGEFRNIWQRTAHAVLFLSALSLAVLIAVPKLAGRLVRFLPAPLLVVVGITMLAALMAQWRPNLAMSSSHLVQVPMDLVGSLVLPDLNKLFTSVEVWKSGLIVGIVATLETLLCVEAIDKLDPHKRTSPVNRELVAQGSGNLACGLLGGIPLTAVIVRGSANIQAGAKSRASGFLHGVLLLGAVMVLPFLINRIPLAALAAILIVTGYKLCSIQKIVSVSGLGLAQALPFFVTLILVVAVDLLIGVTAGLLVACYFILHRTVQTDYDIHRSRSGESEVYEIHLHHNVTFLNKIKLKQTLETIPEYSVVRVNGLKSQSIDYDVCEMLSEFRVKAHDRHIELDLPGVPVVQTASAH